MLRAIWAYRGFMLGSIKREFQSKYRNSLLGAAWAVLQPLSMILVYTVVFSQVMKAKVPGIESNFGYSIYLCGGVLVWGLFAEIATRSQSMFLDNANLLKKLRFPRICLPVMVVATGLLNFGIVFGLFTLFLIVSGNFPGVAYLALLPLIVLLVLFAAGLGIILGVLNVFFRDVGQMFGILITFWFWLTPIVYPKTILPDWVQSFIMLNPMTNIVVAVQDVLVRSVWPAWGQLLYPCVVALTLCLLGLGLFRRRAGEMVDEL